MWFYFITGQTISGVSLVKHWGLKWEFYTVKFSLCEICFCNSFFLVPSQQCHSNREGLHKVRTNLPKSHPDLPSAQTQVPSSQRPLHLVSQDFTLQEDPSNPGRHTHRSTSHRPFKPQSLAQIAVGSEWFKSHESWLLAHFSNIWDGSHVGWLEWLIIWDNYWFETLGRNKLY